MSSCIERKMDKIIFVLFTMLSLVSLVIAIGFSLYTKFDIVNWWYLQPDENAPFYNPRSPPLARGLQFIGALMLYGYVIPISLYVSIDVVKVLQAMLINWDIQLFDEATCSSAEARTSNLNEELSQVEIFLSDNTGTVTCNQMEFRKCSLAGVSYEDKVFLDAVVCETTQCDQGLLLRMTTQLQIAQSLPRNAVTRFFEGILYLKLDEVDHLIAVWFDEDVQVLLEKIQQMLAPHKNYVVTASAAMALAILIDLFAGKVPQSTQNFCCGTTQPQSLFSLPSVSEYGADVIDCSVPMLYARLTKVPDIQHANGVFSFNATCAEIQGLKSLNPAYASTGRFRPLAEFLHFAKTQPILGVLLNMTWAAYLAESQGLDVLNAVLTGLRISIYNDPKSQKIPIQSIDSAILTKLTSLVELWLDRNSLVYSDFVQLASEIQQLLRAIYIAGHATKSFTNFVVGHGELWIAQMLSALVHKLEVPCNWMDPSAVLVVHPPSSSQVDPAFTASSERLEQGFSPNPSMTIIATGFIVITSQHIPISLKRDESEFSAAILGALLKASPVTIWTNVGGVYSADPSKVSEAMILKTLSYQAAWEMSYFGATLLPPRTIFNLALINVEGTRMAGVRGTARAIFGTVKNVGAYVIMISHASSEHSVCFAVLENEVKAVVEALRSRFHLALGAGRLSKVEIIPNCSILATVGLKMASTPGFCVTLCIALAQANINARTIAHGCSEYNITVVVNCDDCIQALRTVHSRMFLSKPTIAMGIIGLGLIGATLLDQFLKLRALQRRSSTRYFYEATIGAGLPILSTLL